VNISNFAPAGSLAGAVGESRPVSNRAMESNDRARRFGAPFGFGAVWQNACDHTAAASDRVECENEPPQLGVRRFVLLLRLSFIYDRSYSFCCVAKTVFDFGSKIYWSSLSCEANDELVILNFVDALLSV